MSVAAFSWARGRFASGPEEVRMLSFKTLLATSAAALLLATSAFAQTGAVGSGATGGAMGGTGAGSTGAVTVCPSLRRAVTCHE